MAGQAHEPGAEPLPGGLVVVGRLDPEGPVGLLPGIRDVEVEIGIDGDPADGPLGPVPRENSDPGLVPVVPPVGERHPAAAALGLEAWLAHPHVIVSPRMIDRTHVDDQLALIGRERRIGAIVPAFSYVPALLAATDLIARLPRRCVPGAGASSACRLPFRWRGSGSTWHGRTASTGTPPSAM